MWFFYAIMGAFFKSSSGLLRKKMTHRIDASVFTWISFAVGIVVFAPLVIAANSPIFELVASQPWLVLGTAVTIAAPTYLNLQALKHEDLSFVAPLTGFVPIFGLLYAWTFIGETPPLIGIAAIILVFVGTYTTAIEPGKIHWYEPIMRIFRSAGALMSLGVAVLYALNTVFIKATTNLGFDSLTVFYCSLLGGLLVTSYVFLSRRRRREVITSFKSPSLMYFGAIFSSLAGSLLHIIAVIGTFASYAIAVRRFDMVFSVLLGWRFLKEKNIRSKLVGTGITLLGVTILILS